MSHLKCTAHERRVIVVDGKVLHRSTLPTEFTANCDTETVLSGAAVYTPDSEHFNSKAFPKVISSGNPETDAVATLQEVARLRKTRKALPK